MGAHPIPHPSTRPEADMPPPLFIVRHGETDWNVEGRLQGQADTDINDRGREQAARNGARLAEAIDDPAQYDFVASPLRRTRETMEILRRSLDLPAEGYRLDPRLMELHFGDWQGFTFRELEARRPGLSQEREADKWAYQPPGAAAESYEALLQRVEPWLRALRRPTVAVVHGGVVRVLFRLLDDRTAADAATMPIPQDRILRIADGRLEWL